MCRVNKKIMGKSETKYNNTALKMHQALFELLETHDFQQITIKQITEKAGVNRCTFYAHYENTYELLEDTQKTFVKDFFNQYAELGLTANQVKDLSKEESNFITVKYLLPYLSFIKENKKIYKVYMQNLSVFKSEGVFQAMLKHVFIPIYEKNGVTDTTIITYLANYYLMGITSIIMRWLERDCIDDIHLICEIIMIATNTPAK